MKKTLLLIFIFTIMLANSSCTKELQATYKYMDGSANTYILSKETLEYKPIDPALSSSGFYDGGEYKKSKISESDYKKIIALFNKTIADTSIQIKGQVPKGSGRIVVEKNNKINSVIIKQNSDKQSQIEQLLNSLLGK